MTETEKIQKRFERGYTMAVYGTREAIHKQMWEDIRVLLCENKALSITAVGCQREQLKAFFNWYDKSMYEGCSDDLIISEYLDNL